MKSILACLFASFFLIVAASPALAEKRVALVIGNSKYEHSSRLKNPGNDARDVATSFKRLGFTDVIVKYDLDYTQLRRTLAAFSHTATGANLAVIYYSGHGIEVDGQNYLVPVDAKLNHAEDVEFEATPLRKAMAALERAGNFRLVILDACRDNPFRSRMAMSGSTRSIGKGFAPVAPGRNTLVAYAAKDGTVAYDGDAKHSPYTTSLLKHMETPGVEIGYLFRLVRDSVLAETGNRQEPFTYGSLGSSRIYLKPGDRSACADAKWKWRYLRRAGGREAKADLEQFIAQHPDCPQAELARAKLKEITVTVGVFSNRLTPGTVFDDCNGADWCPSMVVVPAGSFEMGSSDGGSDEEPVHTVRIAEPFAVGRFEVTFKEWDACVAARGCDGYTPSDQDWGRDKRPVINVSWDDAQKYIKWLSNKSGQSYRLLSEAEWEYVARGDKGSRKYWWGNTSSHEYANYGTDECCSGLASGKDKWKYTSPVGSFAANPFKVHDMHGNVWEWVEDCYHDSYKGAASDGSARTDGKCVSRVLRGGSWLNYPRSLRSANRLRDWPGSRDDVNGFRVARSLSSPRTR